MIFKVVFGVKESVFNIFNLGEIFVENDMSVFDVINQYFGDYKSRIILKWVEFVVFEVIRVLIMLNMRVVRNFEVYRFVMYLLGDKSQL